MIWFNVNEVRNEVRLLGWVKLVGHALTWGIEHSTMARRILALNMPTTGGFDSD